jgi:hypothetical protein
MLDHKVRNRKPGLFELLADRTLELAELTRQEEEANLVSDLQLDLQHPPRIWGEVTGGAEGIRAIGLLVLTTPMRELIAHGAEQGFFAKTGCTTRTALPIAQVLQSTHPTQCIMYTCNKAVT